MKKSQAKKAGIDELLDAYEQAAVIAGKATESGDYKANNKAVDTIQAVYAELRSRGPEARRALLGLLGHEDPGVRLWAASHALDFSPGDGEPVLEELCSVGQLLGFSAKTTLQEWRKGNLKFP
jgi:hypothetical protein